MAPSTPGAARTSKAERIFQSNLRVLSSIGGKYQLLSVDAEGRITMQDPSTAPREMMKEAMATKVHDAISLTLLQLHGRIQRATPEQIIADKRITTLLANLKAHNPYASVQPEGIFRCFIAHQYCGKNQQLIREIRQRQNIEKAVKAITDFTGFGRFNKVSAQELEAVLCYFQQILENPSHPQHELTLRELAPSAKLGILLSNVYMLLNFRSLELTGKSKQALIAVLRYQTLANKSQVKRYARSSDLKELQWATMGQSPKMQRDLARFFAYLRVREAGHEPTLADSPATVAHSKRHDARRSRFAARKGKTYQSPFIHPTKRSSSDPFMGYLPTVPQSGSTVESHYLNNLQELLSEPLETRHKQKEFVIKPVHREPGMPGNPNRGIQIGYRDLGDHHRGGFGPGMLAVRERLAYTLSESMKKHMGMSMGVPETVMMRIDHPNAGPSGKLPVMIQRFAKGSVELADLTEEQMKLIPPEESAKLLLHVMLHNTDGNDGNVLAQKQTDEDGKVWYKLVLIDHGYCLPKPHNPEASSDTLAYFNLQQTHMAWMALSLAKNKLPKEARKRLAKLDIDTVMKELRADNAGLRMNLGTDYCTLPEDCWTLLRLNLLICKLGAQHDCTLESIGSIIQSINADSSFRSVKLCGGEVRELFEGLHMKKISWAEAEERIRVALVIARRERARREVYEVFQPVLSEIRGQVAQDHGAASSR